VDLTGKKSILLFGGTFDPPHVAHVILPMLAMEAVGADAVAYVPAAQSPHKLDQTQTPAQHRLAMLRLALAEVPWATVLTDEFDRFDDSGGQPSYTVDTLTALRATLGPAVTLRLLIGTDQMMAFNRWREPQRIIELADPVVMLRPPGDRETALDMFPRHKRAAWDKRIVTLPMMDISATMIRSRIARGLSITGLVHPAVERYIAEHRLYQ